MPLPSNLPINADRLWDSLAAMAKVGATPKGGNCRLALTDEDKAGRDLFVSWCREAGCTVTVDKVGNIFARRAGRDPDLPPVVMGSHLDTQPTGGRFDGVFGVLAALEVVRSLNDRGVETLHPVEVAVWTNEEGSRFSPPMMGSGVATGVFTLEEILDKVAQDGARLGDELVRTGYAGDAPVEHPMHAYLEAHIEQGPVLEVEGKEIGVVTGAQGQRWYEVTVTGVEAHAGPTPMRLRRDALVAASAMVQAVQRVGLETPGDACATVGILDVHPHSRNVIPGRVFFTVDLRHPDAGTLAEMDRRFRDAVAAIAEQAGVTAEVADFWHFPPTPFAAELVGRVRDAAEGYGFSHRDIVSGAGHDAVYVAGKVPTAMIFIPCENGISHNEVENIAPADGARGAAVLFDALVATAGRP
ncbi:Zn-dependent hydrolase [Azospirillum picis]|uniref:N-carbamoyl-L-amino-acid hydrolase n=1 Tax=Azospirillum picis TaxID=488438 RepID=A0ABU0MUD5_9PROT|nr:Zn-dependent hydrolase [Azospirillum picis]MBP2299159.1 N-carbamoyl-L-amino-acid hydrolase [Azospirillum picis]MDQ0537085.1 N-carbamoyl-L-amino-acid hydrolase [Azospirillum picis]